MLGIIVACAFGFLPCGRGRNNGCGRDGSRVGRMAVASELDDLFASLLELSLEILLLGEGCVVAIL